MNEPTRRLKRVAAAIQQELSEMLAAEVKDPRVLEAGIISITGVDVTPDLMVARIYLTASTDDEEILEEMLVGLGRAAGFLRRELAQRAQLRRTPELRFQLDHGAAAGRRVDAILREIEDDQ